VELSGQPFHREDTNSPFTSNSYVSWKLFVDIAVLNKYTKKTLSQTTTRAFTGFHIPEKLHMNIEYVFEISVPSSANCHLDPFRKV